MKESNIQELAKAYRKLHQHDIKKASELSKSLHLPKVSDLQKITAQQQGLVSQYIKNNYSNSIEGMIANVTKYTQQQKDVLNYSRLLAEDMQKQTKYIQKSVLKDEPKLRDSIKALINIGWYPDIQDFGYRTLRDMKDDIDSEDIIEMDAAFISYYQSIIDKIEEKLTKQFPKRAHIFSEAFASHKEGNYIVSIPLLLTQVDGIAYDAFKSSFFEKSKGKKIPKLSEQVSDAIGYFSVSLLVPFQSEQPIIFGQRDRDEDFNHLNRHQVLHGESIDYHTEVNSCKVISLIYYISQAVKIIKD